MSSHDENTKRAVEHLQRKAALLQDQVTLLDKENHALAARLRDHGVEVHRRSAIHVQLPAVLQSPDGGLEAELALMTRRERRLLDELRAEEPVLYAELSESRADVGHWLWQSRVWAAATRRHLLVFASGRRPLLQRIEFRHLQESLYNHVTGELVLAPDHEFRLARVAMAPVEGYQFLAQIYQESGGSSC